MQFKELLLKSSGDNNIFIGQHGAASLLFFSTLSLPSFCPHQDFFCNEKQLKLFSGKSRALA